MTPQEREVMQMALEALESSRVFVTSREKIKHPEGTEWYDERIEALRAALAQPEPLMWAHGGGSKDWSKAAQPEQEPVAWLFQHEETGLPECVDAQQVEWGFEKHNPRWQKIAPLYTAPPQREWQSLTDLEICEFSETPWTPAGIEAIRAIEAKLREKNT